MTKYLVTLFLSMCMFAATAAEEKHGHHGWKKRSGEDIDTKTMPDSKLRRQLLKLGDGPRLRALATLKTLNVHESELDHLRIEHNGDAVSISCYELPAPAQAPVAPVANAAAIAGISSAEVPISSPPVFHSKPGAPFTIYLDFNGETVTGTYWTNSVNKSCNWEGDPNTFTVNEQLRIYRIWQQVAQTYSPWDVDVTTEPTAWKPGHFAHCVITGTSSTDWYGAAAGGVAFRGSMFWTNVDTPCFVFCPQLGWNDYNVAVAATHEIGHMMGLSHDGRTTPKEEYYYGHDTSTGGWAPIMGVGYGRTVVQWSKGEYCNCSNTEDDLQVITNKIPLRAAEYGNTLATATVLSPVGGTALSAQGIIRSKTDVDVVKFNVGAGPTTISVHPGVAADDAGRGTLDVQIQLLDSAGNLVASSAPTNSLAASITTTLTAGTYYLRISPDAAPANGSMPYTTYGSLGYWFLTGTIAPSGPNSAPTITAIAPSTGTTAGGTVVTITGTNLTGTSNVIFGGTAGTSIVNASSTSITVTTPIHTAGTVDVALISSLGSVSKTGGFTYIASPVPSITSIAPNTGTIAGGTVVTITGTNLTGTSNVTFGGTAGTSIVHTSSTSITVTTPAHIAGTVDVALISSSGSVSKTSGFTYIAPPVPTITTIAPSTGTTAGGTVVTITGTNLAGTSKVTFGGTAGTSIVNASATSITVTSPAHAVGVVDVVLTTSAGSVTKTGGFTYADNGGPSGYTWCAKENGSATFAQVVDVAYGANGVYALKYGVTGVVNFNNTNFGDPIPGVVKAGYYKVSSGQPVAFVNAGFETPSVGVNNYNAFQYNPTGAGWIFVGGAGVTGNGSGFTSGNSIAPEGTQVAFLQSANPSTITQSITFAAGSYQISFKAAQRMNHGNANNFIVTVDGVEQGAFKPLGGNYTSFTTATFTVTTGSHTIQFKGINTAGGDSTAFIDNVKIVVVPAANG